MSLPPPQVHAPLHRVVGIFGCHLPGNLKLSPIELQIRLDGGRGGAVRMNMTNKTHVQIVVLHPGGGRLELTEDTGRTQLLRDVVVEEQGEIDATHFYGSRLSRRLHLRD